MITAGLGSVYTEWGGAMRRQHAVGDLPEALSDDGSLTGRGHPWVRGVICGLMTALGGIGHTLPFLIPDFHAAMVAAVVVVLIELGVISWIRHRYMETPALSAALQVGLGGALVFITGVLIGSS